MNNAEIQTGLTRAGFHAVTTDVPVGPGEELALSVAPNPSPGGAMLRFRLPAAARVRLAAFDVTGREVARLADGSLPAGEHFVPVSDERWPAGVYLYRLTVNGVTHSARGVRLP
jgi:hypothetical protein